MNICCTKQAALIIWRQVWAVGEKPNMFIGVMKSCEPAKYKLFLSWTKPCNGHSMLFEHFQMCCSRNFQNVDTSLSSCDSGCINRAQQACFKPPLPFIYLEGTVLMQPLDPVLLNSSAAADPQTLTSCRGVEDTFCHVPFWACFPSGISGVDSFPSTCSILWFPLHQEFTYFQIESVHSEVCK